MPSYVLSNSNRFYTAIEPSYATPGEVTAANRFQASRFQAQQVIERSRRLDKTGSRTLANTATGRTRTGFEVRTYLAPWAGAGSIPYGPLFQAGLGGVPEARNGLTVEVIADLINITTTTAHQCSVGSALSDGNEIRFITQVLDDRSVSVNVPFSRTVVSGTQLSPTVTYRVASTLPSISIYDYWDPTSAISKIVTGAAVDVLDISINGDRHDFLFSGPAADLIDSATFTSGDAGLLSFPDEPSTGRSGAGVVPGHLGQAWLGGTANQFFTLTAASVKLRNNLDLRTREFGSAKPRAITPGPREVRTSFSLFAQDDSQTLSLYSAARNSTPISAMFQMGQQKGQLMGVYLPSVLPELPMFDDSDLRLQWRFNNNFALGTSNDELYIAFA